MTGRDEAELLLQAAVDAANLASLDDDGDDKHEIDLLMDALSLALRRWPTIDPDHIPEEES